MKRFLQLVSLVAILIGSSVAQQSNQSPIQAQVVVPRLIRFSGQLPGTSGTVGITFTLHKAQQDNAALWIETQNVQLDSTGKYTVLLGVTKPEGIPTDLFSTGEAQWLGIQVQGKTEQPRVLLVSVPYALRAAEADTLAGHAPAEFVTTDKLSSAVQQELQQQSTSTSSPAPGTGKKSAIKPSTPTDPATDFIDNNSSQVVLVEQNGTGSGLTAIATTGLAVNAKSTSTAIYGNNTGTGNTSGVEGTTSSPAGRGVYGLNTATTGTNFGVVGSASSTSGIGVFGSNAATTGVATGVWGSTTSTGGVALKATATGTSGSTTGLLSTVKSPSGTALVLQNTGSGPLISGQSGTSNTSVFTVDGSGNIGTAGSLTAVGVVDGEDYVEGGWGYFDTSVPDFEALIAYSDTTVSGTPTAYFQNSDNTDAGDLVFETYSPSFGGECTIDLGGNLYCTGVLSVVAKGAEGKKSNLYTMQSPENFLEDFGSVKLVNGVAKVNIDAALKGVISDETSYHVFLTPNGDCEGLYVTNRTATTFEVHELKGGKSNIDVDFRIVAHRAGFEHVRMPDVTKQMTVPANRQQQPRHARPLQTAAVGGESRD
jgi:hypothetical protein